MPLPVLFHGLDSAKADLLFHFFFNSSIKKEVCNRVTESWAYLITVVLHAI